MSDEGYKIQLSIKAGDAMLNVRADDAEEFSLTVQSLLESESEAVQTLVEDFELAGEKPKAKKKKSTKKSSKKSRKDDDDDDDEDEEDDEDEDEDEEDEKPKKKRSSRSTKSKKSKGKSRR